MSIKDELVSRRKFLRGSAAAGVTVAAAGVAGGLRPETAQAQGIPAKWDKEVDVVIVGTGHAGLAAAITAADAGAKVVILEKMKKEWEGGNSRVSGNMWWTPTDLPQAVQYIEALSYGLTDKACIQALAEEMLKLNDWLAKLGINHTPLGMFQPEHPELPGSACVRTWGNDGSCGRQTLDSPPRTGGEAQDGSAVRGSGQGADPEAFQGNCRHPGRGRGQALLHQGEKRSDSLLRRIRIRL